MTMLQRQQHVSASDPHPSLTATNPDDHSMSAMTCALIVTCTFLLVHFMTQDDDDDPHSCCPKQTHGWNDDFA